MNFAILYLSAFIAATLTLFSGFGLGTMLLPVFAIFFPINVAIALTAVVHFVNNIFKFSLFRKSINKGVALKFGIPAFIASFLGAFLLVYLSNLEPLFEYMLFGKKYEIETVKLLLSILIMFFALFDMVPRLSRASFSAKYLPFGGLLSGFLGGLSGHQGALRSAFLIKCSLSKESFIATGVAIALLVDMSRLIVYSSYFSSINYGNMHILFLTVLSALIGTFVGSRILKKVTLKALQLLVGIGLFAIAIGLGMGII